MTSKLKAKRGRNKRLPKGPHGGIELLLIQGVENLGKQGDVVEVRPGYANNYLLPQGLATVATEHHKRMIEKHKAKLLEIERLRRANLQARADQLSAESITIEVNATEEGTLYGSVGPAEIIKALRSKSISDVSTDMVRLAGAIKELGLYTIKLHLGQDVDADLKVWVVPAADQEAK